MKLPLTACRLLLTLAPASGQARGSAAVFPGETLFQTQCRCWHTADATGRASRFALTDPRRIGVVALRRRSIRFAVALPQ
jgi:hypothetical protein